MLFHVTAIHTEDNCPAYDESIRPKVREALTRYEEIAKETGVKVHFWVFGLPEHVMYGLVEADSAVAIDHFFAEARPFKQSFRLTPVISVEDRLRDRV